MINPVIIGLLFASLVLLPSCNSGKEQEARRPVILDVDVSVDDLMTILYFLSAPDVDIKAITIVQGVSGTKEGSEIVLRLLAFTGQTGIPVAAGTGRPLEGDNAFPRQWQPPVGKPFGLDLPPHDLAVAHVSAEKIIDSLVTAYPGEITVMALGPMTNVAGAFLKNRTLAASVREVVISDGAVEIEGGIFREYPAIPNRVAGWNLWADPLAAELVFRSGAPIVLIPLDLTALHAADPLVLTAGLAKHYNELANGKTGQAMGILMANWLSSYVDTQLADTMHTSVPIWDVVAGVIWHHPAVATAWDECHAGILLGADEVAGQIVISDTGVHNIRICRKGDQALLDSLLLITAQAGKR